ncbi:hypothetical protein ACVWZB_004798 [Paenibacillus polymyxa]
MLNELVQSINEIGTGISVVSMKIEGSDMPKLYEACDYVFDIPPFNVFHDPENGQTTDLEKLIEWTTRESKREFHSQVTFGIKRYEVTTINGQLIAIDFKNRYVSVNYGGNRIAASKVLRILKYISPNVKTDIIVSGTLVSNGVRRNETGMCLSLSVGEETDTLVRLLESSQELHGDECDNYIF